MGCLARGAHLLSDGIQEPASRRSSMGLVLRYLWAGGPANRWASMTTKHQTALHKSISIGVRCFSQTRTRSTVGEHWRYWFLPYRQMFIRISGNQPDFLAAILFWAYLRFMAS